MGKITGFNLLLTLWVCAVIRQAYDVIFQKTRDKTHFEKGERQTQ